MNDIDHKTAKPEAFIPFLRKHLVNMCVDDGKLDASQEREFRDFCEILSSYSHFQFHKDQEAVKDFYAALDPDREIILDTKNGGDEAAREKGVVEAFKQLAHHANFRKLTEEELIATFTDSTLIKLNTNVDLEDFDVLECYVRGDMTKQTEVKGFLGKKKEMDVRVWHRVLLLIKYKDLDYFKAKKRDKDLNFQPGKMYAYFYKDVPQMDLELLFPNVKVSMTMKDRLMLGIPAIGGGVAALIKILPQLILIFAAIIYLLSGLFGPEVYDSMKENFKLPDPEVEAMKIIVATMAIAVGLGGLAMKQWSAYKGKRIQFLKSVSETLFFRNLATNQSVFFRVIDNAEEEECKEMLLVYYHLLVNPGRQFTAPELDKLIEDWMKDNHDVVIDFDIDGPLDALQKIVGNDRSGQPRPLLSIDESGHIHTLPLEDAKHVVDYLWDTAYQFNEC